MPWIELYILKYFTCILVEEIVSYSQNNIRWNEQASPANAVLSIISAMDYADMFVQLFFDTLWIHLVEEVTEDLTLPDKILNAFLTGYLLSVLNTRYHLNA